MTGDQQRHTVTTAVNQEIDADAAAAREAENGVAQFDAVLEMIDDAVRGGRPFRLRPSRILDLHRIAMDGVHPLAGSFRHSPVEIAGSRHQPPREHLVPALIEEMCDWIEENWSAPAVTLCAYAMWRLNWIHPFADGNGRTSRAVAYLVLCVRAGFSLPGRTTIPEQIADNKTPYYEALERLDEAAAADQLDLTAMEALLSLALQAQLDSAFAAATSNDPDTTTLRKFH